VVRILVSEDAIRFQKPTLIQANSSLDNRHQPDDQQSDHCPKLAAWKQSAGCRAAKLVTDEASYRDLAGNS
jgi:hypothetical protein